MSAVIQLDSVALSEILKILDETGDAIVDMRPAWKKLRTKWQTRVDRQWTMNRWKPLDLRYARAEKGGDRRATLVKSGDMKRDLREPEVFEATSQQLVMGMRFGVGRTDTFYAQFHQQGRGVPRRQIWRRLTAQERADWNQVPADHIFSAIKGS